MQLARRPSIEPLERRTLLAAKAIPLDPSPGPSVDLVYDPTRELLYVVGQNGHVGRYDAATGTALGNWPVGTQLWDADITPDGSHLYVTEGTRPNGTGVIHKVDLTDGSVIDLPYDLEFGEAGGREIVVMSNGLALFTSAYDGWGNTPLRQLNLATGQAVIRFVPPDHYVGDLDMYALLERSADHGTAFLSDSDAPDGRAVVYDADSNRFSAVAAGWYTGQAAVSPDGSLIGERELRDRDLNVVRDLPAGHSVGAFDPVQPVFYTASLEGDARRITAFDVTSGAELFGFPIRQADEIDAHTSFAPLIHPDGSRFWLLGTVGAGGTTQSYLREYPLIDAPGVDWLPARSGAGRAQSFTVTVRDPAGNVRSDFTGTLRFESDDPAAVLPGPVTLTAADAGRATVAVTFNTPGRRRLDVLDATTNVGDSAFTTVDEAGPTAEFSTYSTVDPARSYNFGVVYKDRDRLLASSLGDDDVLVRTPFGGELPVRLVSQGESGDQYFGYTLSARYEIAAPGGRWDPGDNGDYTFTVRDGAVIDDVGNPARAAAPYVFTINVPANTPGDGYVPLPPTPPAEFSLKFVGGGVPSRTMGGTTVRPTAILKNDGEHPFKGTVTFGSDIVSVDDDSQYYAMDDVEYAVDLAPGRSVRIKLEIQLPDDAPDGRYYLATFRNEAVARSKAFRLVERRVELTSFYPFRATPLRSYEWETPATFRVKNTGNVTVSGTYVLEVYGLLTEENADDGQSTIGREGGTLGMLETEMTLRPGQQKTFTINIGLLGRPRGKYFLWLEGEGEDWEDGFIEPNGF